MKIDSVVKNFVESYDEEVMRYLENISSDFALKVSESKIGSIELDESFNQIRKYIEGYSAYKVENKIMMKQFPIIILMKLQISLLIILIYLRNVKFLILIFLKLFRVILKE